MNPPALADAIVEQYLAALTMLRDSIASIPSDMWDDARHENRTWRLIYHTLFFTHLYLSDSEEAFVPWGETEANPALGRNADPLFDGAEFAMRTPEQFLEYLAQVESLVRPGVANTPFDGPSGFSWIPFNRFEHHLYNLRHLQHHASQLVERRRAAGETGIRWAGRSVWPPAEVETV